MFPATVTAVSYVYRGDYLQAMLAPLLAFGCLAARCKFPRQLVPSVAVLFAGAASDANSDVVLREGDGFEDVSASAAKRILVLDPASTTCLDELQEAGYEVTAEHDMADDDLERTLPEYDAVVVRSANQITRSMLISSPRLAVAGRAGSGVDNIDLVAAAELGVPVVNAPTGNARSVAELVFGLMLGLSRSIPAAHDTMRQGKWSKKDFKGRTLMGKTLGIFGFGSVGQELAKMAVGFGMTVLLTNQKRHCEKARSGIADSARATLARKIGVDGLPLPLDELLSKSDFLSLHIPLTLDTKGVIGGPELAMMKSSAVLVNAARGGVVDEQALLQALKEGRLGGAALDVFGREKEPLEESVLELCRLPNVICTPHIGGSTEEAGGRVLGEVCDAVVAVLEGTLPPERVVSGNAHESLRIARSKAGFPLPSP